MGIKNQQEQTRRLATIMAADIGRPDGGYSALGLRDHVHVLYDSEKIRIPAGLPRAGTGWIGSGGTR